MCFKNWAKSTPLLQHSSFKKIISGYDFTFVNFYTSWCSHCREFSSEWRDTAEEVERMKFHDREGELLQIGMIGVT